MVNVDLYCVLFFFFFQAEDGIRDLTVTGVQTCALPICRVRRVGELVAGHLNRQPIRPVRIIEQHRPQGRGSTAARSARLPYLSSRYDRDRKSTRLNSSHSQISYAVFCLKKKKDYTAAQLQPITLQSSYANRSDAISGNFFVLTCFLLY